MVNFFQKNMPKDFSFCSTFNFSRFKKIKIEEFQNVDLVGVEKLCLKEERVELSRKKP